MYLSTNSFISIELAHSNELFGHSLCPCIPQGRHGKSLWVCTILQLLDSGPNPNSGIVEQNMAVTGASTLEHKCMGDESHT